MAKLSIQAGATSQSVNIFVQNSSLTTGAGLTGLVFNTSGLTAYYSFTGTNAGSVAISLATLAAVNSAFSSGGFKEIDSTNMPGIYRLDIPNAALAASKGQSVTILLQGATNMAESVLEIELTAVNNQSTGFGLVNASANAVQINGVATTSVTTIGANVGTTQPVNFTGTGASAFVQVDLKTILGTASAGTAGFVGIDWAHINAPTTTVALTNTTISAGSNPTAAQVATAVWQDSTAGDFTVANSVGKSLYNAFTSNTSVFTTASLVNAPTGGSAPTVSQIATAVWQDTTAGDFTVAGSIGKGLFTSGVVPGGAGGVFIAGSNAATTVNFTGNLSGTVGSVTGAVGSVTGAVGSVAAGGITTASFAAFAESYTVLGTTSSYTLPNLVFDIHRELYARSVSGTTESILKMDGATTAHTITLNSTTPSSAIQAT